MASGTRWLVVGNALAELGREAGEDDQYDAPEQGDS